MNILVDIGHPAHVHYYRNLIDELRLQGHKITVTVKEIPVIKVLLDYYKIPYIVLSGKGRGLLGKILKQVIFDIKIFRISKKEKIDLALGTSITITHLTFLAGVPSLFFEDDDDEVVPLSVRFGHPFASLIISPDCLRGKKKNRKTVFYPGYHELAYLHPKRFSPDDSVLKNLGVAEGEKYFLMRFSALDAHHDTGARGITTEMKIKLIDILRQHGKVFITSEKETEKELAKYIIPSAPHMIHSAMYYSHIFISDSQTMTSEAAMMGVPSLRCNSFSGRISYLKEQEEKYSLTFSFTPDNFEGLLGKLHELLALPGLKEIWRVRRDRMLEDKMEVTSFWRWITENYGLLRKNPEVPEEIIKQFR